MNTEKGGYRIDEALAAVDEASPGAVVMSRRSFAKFGAAVAAAAAMGTLGTYAFFTGTDRKENQVSVADNLNVKVVEPAWDPEASKNVVPGQHVPKDPRIRNLHDAIDGYLFVEIRVPTAVVSVYDPQTQTVLPAARTPLFSFDASEEWVVLQTFDDGDDAVWRFGWPDPIGPKSDTPPIFEEVVVANLAEEQGQAGEHVVGVTGYGIQSTGFTSCQDAWDAYKKQNGIGDGAPPAGVSAVTAGTLLKFVADTPPEVGDTLDGAEVTCVVPDVEKGPVGCLSDTPEAIEHVECLVPTAPESTAEWFKDMSSCEAMDLSGLDTAGIKDSAGMFAGTAKLVEVTMDPAADPSILPEGFKADDGRIVYKRGSAVYALVLKDPSNAAYTNVALDRFATAPLAGSYYRGREISAVVDRVETRGPEYANPGWFDGRRVCSVEINCPVAPISTVGWFAEGYVLSTIKGLENLDTSKVTDMGGMFRGCYKLKSLDLSGFDTSKVTNMSDMFKGCSGLTSLNIPGWDTSKVISMRTMFNQVHAVPSDVEKWDTSNVQDMESMFEQAGHRTYGAGLDLSGWDVSKVASLSYMFKRSSFGRINVSGWNAASATIADEMFNEISGLQAVDAKNANLSGIRSASGMFIRCTQLETVALDNCDFSNVTTMAGMFEGCTNLMSVTHEGWNIPSVTDMSYMFSGARLLVTDCSAWDVSKVTEHEGFCDSADVVEPAWAA